MTNLKEQTQEFWIDLDKQDYSEQKHFEYEVCFVEKKAYDELKSKLETAIKALEFYADFGNWTQHDDQPWLSPSMILNIEDDSDGGGLARKALKEINHG